MKDLVIGKVEQLTSAANIASTHLVIEALALRARIAELEKALREIQVEARQQSDFTMGNVRRIANRVL